MVENTGKTQFYEKHCKNNEKPMKFDEKQCKNNEKIMKTDGSRTSTLARGLRPVQVVFPLTRARVSGKTGPRTSTHPPGVLQRGNTTGKQKGNTTGKKWKNEK